MAQRRKRLLSVESILDAALACVDDSGRLTMADLAARLGASASSIYHHLPGRAAIIEALRERLGDEIGPPPMDGSDWDAQIRQWMRSYRQAMAEHPNLIPLLTEQTMTAGTVLRGYEQIVTLLTQVGAPAADIALWISVLDSYALGSALDLAAPDEVWHADPDTLPALAEAISMAPRGRPRADKAFELGLNALLAGMRDQLGGSSAASVS
ncbi:TetR/AcrR family transcriptional regulator [Actinocrispum wychmicini]|uniref:TetR family transcriptional regulator n=1 Tax=Actinocrispum wychmicini TaxID=1213861 RepID=A0A4R2JY97_9PSEU|nr:TetR/AcrR family transcriptional regulator [Actinocrispum wychmicini]TCO62219.1 TetR family transcriptional regulator [Actinocrispum wychmicini]